LTCLFGSDLIFTAPKIGIALHVEICEDLLVPIPPSTEAALAGANVLVNLSPARSPLANPTIGDLCPPLDKCVAARLYSGAGRGESTTDLEWDGHASSTRTATCCKKANAIRRPRASSPLMVRHPITAGARAAVFSPTLHGARSSRGDGARVFHSWAKHC
jgi:NAD+ synthase (glutamine-hydrolysing)